MARQTPSKQMRFQHSAELSKRQVERAKVIWDAVPVPLSTQVYGFTVRICSLAIAGQHLSIVRQVHGLCLGLTGRLREKRTSPPFLPPLPPFPPSRPLPFHAFIFPPPFRSRPTRGGEGLRERCSLVNKKLS